MSMVGLVERVEVAAARTFAGAAAAAAATVLTVEDGTVFETTDTTGQLVLATGEVCDYNSWTATTVTLVAGLPVGVDVGDPIEVYPERSIKTAYVDIAPDDEFSDTVPCRVPHGARAYTSLAEGTYEGAARPQVQIELSGGSYVVVDGDALNQNPGWDAGTGPITVSNADGEDATVNASGFSTHTNDPVPLRTIVAPQGWMFTYLKHAVTIDGLYAYVLSTEIDGDGARIEKYYLPTGARSGSGSGFITTAAFGIASSGGFLYTVDAAALTIRKWNASTGAEVVTGGFPINIAAVGTTSGEIAVSGSNLFIVDGSGDIRSYQLSNGAARAGNFPLVGTYFALSAADAGAFNVCSGTTTINRFDANGVAVGAPFPVTSPDGLTPDSTASAGGRLLVLSGGAIVYALTEADGVEIAQGWPLVPSVGSHSIAADGTYLAVTAESGSVTYPSDPDLLRVYNNAAGFQSTEINSSDGTARVTKLTASDVEAAGDLTVGGRASLSDSTFIDGRRHDALFHTRGSRTAAHTIADSADTNVSFDTWEGSSQNGPFWSWDTTNRRWTILQNGLYICHAGLIWASNNVGIRRLRLFAGSFVAGTTDMEATTAGIYQNVGTGVIWLTAGSLVYLAGFQNSGGALSIASSSSTWISIARMGSIAA